MELVFPVLQLDLLRLLGAGRSHRRQDKARSNEMTQANTDVLCKYLDKTVVALRVMMKSRAPQTKRATTMKTQRS